MASFDSPAIINLYLLLYVCILWRHVAFSTGVKLSLHGPLRLNRITRNPSFPNPPQACTRTLCHKALTEMYTTRDEVAQTSKSKLPLQAGPVLRDCVAWLKTCLGSISGWISHLPSASSCSTQIDEQTWCPTVATRFPLVNRGSP